MRSDPPLQKLRCRCFRVPTETPEADGTLDWSATEVLLVSLEAGGETGFGVSYTQARAAAGLVQDQLWPVLEGRSPFDNAVLWQQLRAALRNAGLPALGMMAVAAVDQALWDLKARLLDVPLARLWGLSRERITGYGSGGFTNFSDARLREQLGHWVASGFGAVKIKIGRAPARDPARLRLARDTIGEQITLMVDANGAFTPRQALVMAAELDFRDVHWFEEPVSSDDLRGLCWLRNAVPEPVAIAAGEYGWDAGYFRRMLESGAVDVLQADATRCGYTGFLQAAQLCEAFERPLSAHCAPAIHACVCASVRPLRHQECFSDHMRLESMLFDGVPVLHDGELLAPLDRPGHGLQLRQTDAARFEIH